MNTHELGDCYEEQAAAYLKEQGCEILARKYRCRQGEIDLIVKDGCYVVFVEVKYRRTRAQGGPLAAVTQEKQRKISRAALYYLLKEQGSEDIPCRFDVIGMEKEQVTWIKNAFEYCRERKNH